LANIQKLANKAERLCRQRPSLSRPKAARKVVKGQGIFHEPDVKRLVKAICSELGRRGGTKKAESSARAKSAQKLHERIAP